MAVITLDGGSVPALPVPVGGPAPDGFSWMRATVTTTSATPRDVTELQRAIPDGDSFFAVAYVIAKKSDGTTKTVSPTCAGKRVSGALELLGADAGNDRAFVDADAAPWFAGFVTVGADLLLRLYPEAGVTIEWDIAVGVRFT